MASLLCICVDFNKWKAIARSTFHKVSLEIRIDSLPRSPKGWFTYVYVRKRLQKAAKLAVLPGLSWEVLSPCHSACDPWPGEFRTP